MARRQPDPYPDGELPPPAVIARHIEEDLTKALREIRAVARSLEGPPEQPLDGQLALDI